MKKKPRDTFLNLSQNFLMFYVWVKI